MPKDRTLLWETEHPMWSMQKVYKGWWPDPPWKQVQSLITPAGCPIQGDHLTFLGGRWEGWDL